MGHADPLEIFRIAQAVFCKISDVREKLPPSGHGAGLSRSIQSFPAIVGPNGSGKLNTMDALLFVFGYRASKMRQGKLSELIHNSARYTDLDFCSVEVHFREILDLVSSSQGYIRHLP